jgi:hypothetical protein
MKLGRNWMLILTAAVVPWLAACEESTGPGAGGNNSLSLSVTVPASTAAAAAYTGPATFDLVFNDGTNTLTLTRVAIVLREIELERVNDDDCDDHVTGGDDDCEEFDAGPMILELPMDETVDHVVTIGDVPQDFYDEIEFEIHKLERPEDNAILDVQPEFERVSIWVEGDFEGRSFTFITDLNEEQEIEISPPMEIGAGPNNLTLSMDVERWFVDGLILIDPATANKGGPNEGLVRNNIEKSIEVFEDDDRDGHDDGSDDS